jgi:hypothetical protein
MTLIPHIHFYTYSDKIQHCYGQLPHSTVIYTFAQTFLELALPVRSHQWWLWWHYVCMTVIMSFCIVLIRLRYYVQRSILSLRHNNAVWCHAV